MKRRMSVSVTALAIAFVLAFAAPAQAVHAEVANVDMIHRTFGGIVYLFVSFVVRTSMTPYQVYETEPTEDCSDNRPVEIQKKTSSGAWKTVKNGKTNAKAKFAGKMKDRPGTYRVMVPEYMTPAGTQCFEAISKAKTHRH